MEGESEELTIGSANPGIVGPTVLQISAKGDMQEHLGGSVPGRSRGRGRSDMRAARESVNALCAMLSAIAESMKLTAIMALRKVLSRLGASRGRRVQLVAGVHEHKVLCGGVRIARDSASTAICKIDFDGKVGGLLGRQGAR